MCRVGRWLADTSGFLSKCYFRLFGDAYLTRYLRIVCMFRTDKQHEWRCESCILKSMLVWELNWRLLGSCCWHVLRHSVHEGWEEVAQSWFLETCRSLWSPPHGQFRVPWPAGVSTQGHADLLAYCLERSASFISTSLDCLLTQETRGWRLTGSSHMRY